MAKGWIKKAIAGAHGQFRKKAEAAGETTREFARAHEHDSGKTGAQARLAENLMGMHRGNGGANADARRKRLTTMYTHPRSRKDG